MDKQHKKCREKNNSASYEYSKVTQLNKMNMPLHYRTSADLIYQLMRSLHKTRNSRPWIYKIIVQMSESKLERKERWKKNNMYSDLISLDTSWIWLVRIELSQILANEAVFTVGKRWHNLFIFIYLFFFFFLAPFWTQIPLASQQEISIMSQTVHTLQSLQLNTRD